jgi:oligopeptidase A
MSEIFSNPLLSTDFLIPFDAIRPEHVESGVREALSEAENALSQLLVTDETSYAATVGALESLSERLSQVFRRAQHLTSVKNSPELRAAYNAVLPEYSAFFAQLPLNAALWQVIKRFADSAEARQLDALHQRSVEQVVRQFRRAGADLPEEDKLKVKALTVKLSQLSSKFAENVLDATNAFELVVKDKSELAGLPESLLEAAREDAARKDMPGYRFTLQAPSFIPFMKYAENRGLRQQMYTAYFDRASGGELDNRPLLADILSGRSELASLLGYQDFADYQLEERMMRSGTKALDFTEEIFNLTLPYWRHEIDALRTHAKSLGISRLEPWDIMFVSEQLRRATFDFDDEVLRPYFPLEQVLDGLFAIAERLFNIRISQRDNPRVWHPEVSFYEIHDASGLHLGSFYTDWFPREDKRAGAWMNAFYTGGPQADGSFSPHLGLMCANFSRPQGDNPALLTHNEVQTTFHEFGHLLHHLLSRVEIPSLAGTNVAWDFVELPSQLMENWAFEREALDLFARHYETGETIPETLYQKMLRARTFMEANAQMRQLSYAVVDLKLHTEYQAATQGEVIPYANRVMERFSIEPHFAHNNFLAGFSHVFAGGYAAGYYSYKWSEVLEADVFTRFKQEGIFNPETGQAFVKAILGRGDSEDPEVLFREFMGRGPDVRALIARNLGPLPSAVVAS